MPFRAQTENHQLWRLLLKLYRRLKRRCRLLRHKIKIIDPARRASTTLLGTGKAGLGTPGATLELYEPGGLDFADGVLFVADTNNHRIIRIDPESKQWAVVTIEGLTAIAGDDRE